MTLRVAALTFRIQRFEATLVFGAAVLSVLVSAIVMTWIRTAGYDRCLGDDPITYTGFCQASVGSWLFRIVRVSMGVVPVFPIVAGLLIGVPIVARELESGTARLAWSLGPSRLQWFVHRAAPALLLAILAGLAIGLTADALLHLSQPRVDIDQSFVGFRQRGLLIAVQTLVVASVALGMGSVLGRAIPTFIVSLVLVAGILAIVDKVERQLLTNEAQVSSSFDWGGNDTDLFLESRIEMPDGQVLTWDQMAAQHPEIIETGYNPDVYRDVMLYIPGSRYRDIELREAGVLTIVAGLFIALATVTVIRRRPR
jgi:hypothetical protein